MRFLIPICLLVCCSVYSQKPACSCSFQSILSAGLAAGKSAAMPIFQGSAGVNFNNYFIGIGAGIDAYRYNTIPIFADLRRDFGKKNTAFLYSQVGYNIPYNNESVHNIFGATRITDKFGGGLYLDAGIGYRIHLKGSHRLLLSTGYSYKKLSNNVAYSYRCITAPCGEDRYYYEYSLGRIITKISWEFNKRRMAD